MNDTSPDLPLVFQHYRDELEIELRTALGNGSLGLRHMLQYHMGLTRDGSPYGLQGKALRPTLCLLACEATGGAWTQAMPAAAALELTHNFSLIHDDIQDGDTERHHHPTVWHLFGIPKAITAGNTMRSLADLTLMQLTQEGVSQHKALKASATLTQGCLEMILGQYLDISFERRLDVTVSEYLDMISKKTGALMEISLRMGALIGCDDVHVEEAFGHCGRLLGVVFQIRDDILGIWGDSYDTGKPLGSDICRRKKTLPVIYTIEKAQGRARGKLEQLYSKETMSEKEVGQVLSIMETVGAQDYSQRLAKEKCQDAIEVIERVPMSSWALEGLHELAYFLLNRDH